MSSILLIVNIVLSYVIWIVSTRILYSKIKNLLIYVTLTCTIYSLLPLYYVLVYYKLVVLLPIILVYILTLISHGGTSFLETALIPSPIIIVSVYLLMVY
ncbi:MAG: hypothetical protein LM567_01940 [Desulfurococcaceae archaeon]|nr:hypothetical protein [Desulfurococcaceae archaeon]